MASRRVILQIHRSSGTFLKSTRALGCFQNRVLCSKEIQKSPNGKGCFVPVYSVNNTRTYTTEAEGPGNDDNYVKRIHINESDNDFINSFGLVMNEHDEAITVVLGNQMRKELWEGCHNEEESRLIKMATGNLKHHFLNDALSEEANFWIKYCSFAPDNTIFPYVYKFDDSAFLPYAFEIDYSDVDSDQLDDNEFRSIYEDTTISPKSGRFTEVCEKAGIFYSSNSYHPDDYDNDGYEPHTPKSSNFA